MATCPRCDHQGVIQLVRIKKLGQVVNVCEECDALWLTELKETPVYGTDFVDFSSYLEEHGIPVDEAEWEQVK